MRGSGGTEGGVGKFFLGLFMAGLALYLFIDSVRVTTAGFGLVSGTMRRAGGIFGETTSMAIVFVPFFLGVMIMFYDSSKKIGSWLTMLGLAVIVFEVVSRIRFFMNVKLTHFLFMVVLLAAGAGLMFRSFRDETANQSE
ncbi:MAG: hypothetical protein CMJ78_13730 [Planctomycetaceae bacterium]|nr:hypothetical protein [Planctomycetaceae bacterium]